MSADTIDDISRLIRDIDTALAAHRTTDEREVERLTRWRRELCLQLSDLKDHGWGC